ncbi:hypothetical protein ATH50_1970 [Haloplanus aerogenes]|uniref:Ig-like domain-containing protein n=1 Tax=Haloplanus aerogenes TaxID=660522 RepID=A0A3M0DHC5_9EURY|nr:hypothetical protein ATH50_1970 [Haloplanus aerogenes]
MNRRETLGVMASVVAVISGCSQPEVTERPTGEVDIAFSTEADRDYLIRVEVVDADGTLEDEFETAFPPDQQGAPSYYSSGLANGPYTITIQTEAEQETLEWSITDCPSLEVSVTVLADGQLEVDRTCASS